MVKIPPLPGSYRPGDVVNGHVLSERGHWVSLADASSRGVRPRRYLSTQVSTIRSPRTPTQELAERPREVPHQPAPVPPGPTTAVPQPSADPAQLPRVRATPSASAPAPARASRSVTPPGGRQRRSPVGGIIWFGFVLFILWRVFGGMIQDLDLFGDSGDVPRPGQTVAAADLGPVPVEVLGWETWNDDGLDHVLVYVADHESGAGPLQVHISVDAFDADDDLLGSASTSVYLPDSNNRRVIVPIHLDEPGWIDSLEVYADGYPVAQAAARVEVLSWEVDWSQSPALVTAQISARDLDESTVGLVTAVVRGGDGLIVAGHTGYAWGLDENPDEPITVELWGVEEPADGYTVEVNGATF